MAAAANPSVAARRTENLNSPQSRGSRGWTQIVRGEPESAAPPSPSSPDALAPALSGRDCSPAKLPVPSAASGDLAAENQGEGSENAIANSNAAKKPAWNKPSGGAVEPGPVMGALSWPALSESAKANAKPQSDSSKGPEEGPSSLVPTSSSQGGGVAAAASSSSSSSSSSSYFLSPKQVVSNANPNATPNNAYPGRHRGSKRGGGGDSAGNNGSSKAQAAPVAGMEAPLVTRPSPTDPAHKTGNWDSGQRESPSHSNSNHPQQQRHSFRRGNGGPHPRGDGSYHHNYGGRRDRGRDVDRIGNHDWNPHRYYNGRDSHLHPQRAVPRAFVRPPPHASTFMAPPPLRPFSNPMRFDLPSPLVYIPHEPFRGVPFIPPMPPPPAMIFPDLDPQLHATIVTQIDYYFSNENLIKDTYLRQNMDDQGWIPIKLIAGFNKVKKLTDNIQLIVDALRTSSLVEVQGDKVRRRNDWMKWIMPSAHFPPVSGSHIPGGRSHEMVASRVQSIALEEPGGLADVQFVSGNIISAGNLNQK